MKRAYRAKTKRMRTAVKTVALMSLGIPLATMPAVAQDDEGELTPVVITGSNIPTVELEGPAPRPWASCSVACRRITPDRTTRNSRTRSLPGHPAYRCVALA